MNTSYGLILFIAACTINQTWAQSVTDNLIDDPTVHEHILEEDEEIYSDRDGGHASKDVGDPKEYLDAKIFDLFSRLPGLISSAKLEIEEKLRFTLFKKNTQGWSIVAAGINDIFGDYVGNDYKITSTNQIYTYGFLFFYGLGFGFPALVGNPSLPPIDCSVDNYQNTLERYGLTYGPTTLASQVGVKSARSLVKEFDTFVRLELACILDEENNCESAAEVKWTLDNLIASYDARLDLEATSSGYIRRK